MKENNRTLVCKVTPKGELKFFDKKKKRKRIKHEEVFYSPF